MTAPGADDLDADLRPAPAAPILTRWPPAPSSPRNGSQALPPKRKDVACTQVYGGPQTATIRGTWQGRQVLSSFSRTDGCEISRWDLLQGLLPPGGQ